MDNRVFFPLRSNVGWFQSEDMQNQIENSIKQAILIYDEIFIEDGTYRAWVLETGQFQILNPPGTFPTKDRKIEYERDFKLSDFAVQIRPSGTEHRRVMMQGKPIARFKIDYSSVFRDIDPSSHKFLQFVVIPSRILEGEPEKVMRQQSHIDKQAFKDLHPNTFFRNFVIDNLNMDIMTSILLHSSVVLDARHEDLLQRKCRLPESMLKSMPMAEEIALRHLVSVAAPDFSKLAMGEVIELREDETWLAVRQFVSELIASIKSDPGVLVEPRELDSLIQKRISKELLAELERKHMTNREFAIQLGLGVTSLIPGYGMIPTTLGIFKSSAAYLQDKSAWYAFLMKLRSRSKPRSSG